MAIFSSLVFSSCSKSNDTDNDDNTGGTLPDAVFNMAVTGAEDYTFNFTLPANVASDHAINGTQQSSQSLYLMGVSTLPVTWQYSLAADIGSMTEGTYDIKVGLSAFTIPEQTNSYIAISGTMTITKADLYQSVASTEDWFVDGTFSGTYQDSGTPPNEITITGSFSGVNIKSQ